jgi:hypothetical protein
LVAQSGLILSVVITVEALAEIDVVLRRGTDVGGNTGLPREFKDDEDDIADVTFPIGFLLPIPT